MSLSRILLLKKQTFWLLFDNVLLRSLFFILQGMDHRMWEEGEGEEEGGEVVAPTHTELLPQDSVLGLVVGMAVVGGVPANQRVRRRRSCRKP